MSAETTDPRNQMSKTLARFVDDARDASARQRISFEGTDPEAVRLSTAALDELVSGLCRRAPDKAHIRQIMLFAPRHQVSPLVRNAWRDIAGRCVVERVYLLAATNDGGAAIQRQIADDKQSGLDARVIKIDSPAELNVPMSDVWMIDDQLAVHEESATDGPSTWLVSTRGTEVERARNVWNQLADRRVHDAPSTRTGPELSSMLLRSAGLLYSIAPTLCSGSDVDDEDCSWYHGAWQYLRLLDMVSSPSWHSKFYLDAVHAQVKDGARRILIAGCADYSTLAFFLHGARLDGDLPDDLEIHVADKCQTPLLACQWYATQVGLEVTVHKLDLTAVGRSTANSEGLQPGAFDMIITDAFLTRFSRETVTSIVDSWRTLLRKNGKVITTVRLHPRDSWEAIPSREDEDQPQFSELTERFELRLRERAASWRSLIGIDAKVLSHVGRRYAHRIVSHDLGDRNDLLWLFRRREFDIQQATTVDVDGEFVRTEYLQLIASRL